MREDVAGCCVGGVETIFQSKAEAEGAGVLAGFGEERLLDVGGGAGSLVHLAMLRVSLDATDNAILAAVAAEGRMLDRVECSREFYKLLAMATRNKVIAMIVDSVTEIHMRFVYAKVVSSGAATPVTTSAG